MTPKAPSRVRLQVLVVGAIRQPRAIRRRTKISRRRPRRRDWPNSAASCAVTAPEPDPDETPRLALGPAPARPSRPRPCPGRGTAAEHRRHPRRRPRLRRCRLLWRAEGQDAEHRPAGAGRDAVHPGALAGVGLHAQPLQLDDWPLLLAHLGGPRHVSGPTTHC